GPDRKARRQARARAPEQPGQRAAAPSPARERPVPERTAPGARARRARVRGSPRHGLDRRTPGGHRSAADRAPGRVPSVLKNENDDMALDALVIAAHPDDAEISLGGTLFKLIDAKKRVGVLDLTRGEMGTRGTQAERDA